MKTQSIAVLNHNAKELRKLFNKEGQGALKSYYEKELRKAEFALKKASQNQSGYVTPRSPWLRLPNVRYEPI